MIKMNRRSRIIKRIVLSFAIIMLVMMASAPPLRSDQESDLASTETEASDLQVDPALPAYQPKSILSGRLRSVGSDTMDRLMQSWEKKFKQWHPDLQIFHEGKGSGTAVINLVEELSDIGPMSRLLADEEIRQFQSKFGYPPVQVGVAIDAVAVYVHPNNDLSRLGLSLYELDAIFSSTRKRGYPKDLSNWGQLDLTGDYADATISVYSRNKISGTYHFFRAHILNKGEYKSTNHELIGSAAVIQSVANDPFGIGFSGIGYNTAAVKTVPLRLDHLSPGYGPDPEHVCSGQYPLARMLFLTINYRDGDRLKPLQYEFLRFVLSSEGQEIVVKQGFYPLNAMMTREQLSLIGIR